VAGTRYDAIGLGYARTRRADPRLAAVIARGLGGAQTVVNVGAGAGSYEPTDRLVIAVEPSDVMARQRPDHLPPAIRAGAGRLPLRDGSVDAAMAVLSVHHWDDETEAGVRELRRVARGPVVIVTFEVEVSSRMWLAADYLPEVVETDRRSFPSLDNLAEWLGGSTRVEAWPIPRDCSDWTFGSLWAHPERALDEQITAAMSGFARLQPGVRERAMRALAADLADGTWDARHGRLRTREDYDAGLRVLVNQPVGRAGGRGRSPAST
jgi:SAM-dependent methyltransferase